MRVPYSVLKIAIRGGWTPHSEYAMPAGKSGQLLSYGDAKEQCRQFNAKVMADGVVEGKFQWMMPVCPLWDPQETAASS